MAVVGEECSMEHISPSELYPYKTLMKEEPSLLPPFPALCGENITHLGRTADGVICLSDYRLFIRYKDTFANIPLGLVETLESRDIFHLHIYCKDAHSLRCTFPTNEQCMQWYRYLSQALEPARKLHNVFAFAFWARSKDNCERPEGVEPPPGCELLSAQSSPYDGGHDIFFDREATRLGFDLKSAWRITHLNENYRVCSTYPKDHIVPHSVTDEMIEKAAGFRACHRFPSVSWRDVNNGAVIARCSQPEVGWLGWRSPQDETLLQEISNACLKNCSPAPDKDLPNGACDNTSDPPPQKKMMVIDARSYTAAVANRAKGGGSECIEYYPNCEILFMSLANIHSIRKSFQAVRNLCTLTLDQAGWLAALDNTKWLHHIGGLMRTAVIVVNAVSEENRPVLVHCSDGWDRTPQIVALAKLLLDPYYRTIEGFQTLVEREWLAFGHKFSDRCGQGRFADDSNERCPVFLQWLDCVHQLLLQFPCAFQFNQAFLVKLVQHTYSCLFGTFLCNFEQQRELAQTRRLTCSVWALLHPENKKFINMLYRPSPEPILHPSFHLRHLQVWQAVYLSETAPTAALEEPVNPAPTPEEESSISEEGEDKQALQKTRSCENLASISELSSSMSRRLSDPNLTMAQNPLMKSCPALKSNDTQDIDKDKEESENGEEKIVDNENNQIENGQNGIMENGECSDESNDQVIHDDDSAVVNGHRESPDIELCNGDTCETEEPQLQKSVVDHSTQASISVYTNGNGYMSESTSDSDCSSEADSDGCVPADEGDTEPGIKILSTISDLSAQGSTDTLVEDVEKTRSFENEMSVSIDKINRINSSHTAEHLKKVRTDNDSIMTNGHSNGLPTKLNEMSTSTSDISDSHVSILLGRHLSNPMLRLDEALMSVTMGNWKGDHKSAAEGAMSASSGKASSSSMDSATSTPQLSQTPGSTAPPTPAGENKVCPWVRRQASGVGRHLDCDGLASLTDPVQSRLAQLAADNQQAELEYQCRIQQLEAQLRHAKTLLYQYSSGKNGAGKLLEPRDETLSLGSTDSGEHASLGGGSTTASDVSWEQLDGQEAPVTLWVPDHVVTHCAACHQQFCIVRRKHHCRNCGNVFCGECSKFYAPIPQQQLEAPVRVCGKCFQNVATNGLLDAAIDDETSQETLVSAY